MMMVTVPASVFWPMVVLGFINAASSMVYAVLWHFARRRKP